MVRALLAFQKEHFKRSNKCVLLQLLIFKSCIVALEECAFNDTCARNCIRAYTSRYAHLCKEQLGKSTLSCEDYGRMHNGGGPSGCSGYWTLFYVDLMRNKCTREELDSVTSTTSVPQPTTTAAPTRSVMHTRSSRPSSSQTRRPQLNTAPPSSVKRLMLKLGTRG